MCRKIIANGSIGDISGLPFVVGALNCAVWLRYGILIDDAPLMLVNGIGCSLQIGYEPITFGLTLNCAYPPTFSGACII